MLLQAVYHVEVHHEEAVSSALQVDFVARTKGNPKE
jgi:hypothetical protein